MKRKAIIISIAGKSLSNKEKKLISSNKPWGIILFKRNVQSFNQLKNLILSIKKTIKDNHYPILIDEEGGDVSRLSKFLSNKKFSQKFFGDLYDIDKKLSFSLYTNYINSLCNFLNKLGININTVPVLDISFQNTNKILKNRIYSCNKKIVNDLGVICLKTYKKNKIHCVIKHMPGHGRSSSDSHKVLPVINKSLKELNKNDFNCFKNKNSLFAMTAHIIYNKIDSKNPATHSEYIIKNIIRKEIKFRGILISDDISMKALKNDLVTNALKSIKAGCNLALYCSGKYSESAKLLKHVPLIDNFTIKKTSEFYKFLR
tara:strand:+ start:9337 stop:10284 length:948 start_codon:yes stop_codon:yes gene_type:complete